VWSANKKLLLVPMKTNLWENGPKRQTENNDKGEERMKKMKREG
jgi:hypothetical protein